MAYFTNSVSHTNTYIHTNYVPHFVHLVIYIYIIFCRMTARGRKSLISFKQFSKQYIYIYIFYSMKKRFSLVHCTDLDSINLSEHFAFLQRCKCVSNLSNGVFVQEYMNIYSTGTLTSCTGSMSGHQ